MKLMNEEGGEREYAGQIQPAGSPHVTVTYFVGSTSCRKLQQHCPSHFFPHCSTEITVLITVINRKSAASGSKPKDYPIRH